MSSNIISKVFEVLEVTEIKYENIKDLKGSKLEIITFGEGENKISYLLFDKMIWVKEFNKELTYIPSENVYHLDSKIGYFILKDINSEYINRRYN